MVRYAISDRGAFAGGESARQAALVRWAGGLAERGVHYLQLREKDLAPADLAELARGVLTALGGVEGQVRLLVNGPVPVAVALRAAGVHLPSGADAGGAEQVRAEFRAAGLGWPVLSVSCHRVREVELARGWGADLVLFGPVFEKRVHGEVVAAGVGLPALREACEAAGGKTGVLALGGVTEGNTPACMAAGATGVAAIRMFLPGRA